jgi:hypothetical protein
MNRDDVVVATMTRVRSAQEGELIVRGLERVVESGLPIAVSDRDSPRSFCDRLGRLPGVTIVEPDGNGLVGQIVASVSAALETGRRFVLYTEPDKEGFFDAGMDDFLRRAQWVQEPAAILAARSRGAFATFPAFQQLAERAANELCAEAIGTALDYFYGPFLMDFRTARYVMDVPRDLGWGWRPYVFASAANDRRSLAAIEGEFHCPSDQRCENDDDKAHRLRQFAENVRGLLSAIRKPLAISERPSSADHTKAMGPV